LGASGWKEEANHLKKQKKKEEDSGAGHALRLGALKAHHRAYVPALLHIRMSLKHEI
jgi:hypothetical protein